MQESQWNCLGTQAIVPHSLDHERERNAGGAPRPGSGGSPCQTRTPSEPRSPAPGTTPLPPGVTSNPPAAPRTLGPSPRPRLARRLPESAVRSLQACSPGSPGGLKVEAVACLPAPHTCTHTHISTRAHTHTHISTPAHTPHQPVCTHKRTYTTYTPACQHTDHIYTHTHGHTLHVHPGVHATHAHTHHA